MPRRGRGVEAQHGDEVAPQRIDVGGAEHLSRPSFGRHRREAPLDLVARLDLEARRERRHPIQPGARRVDVAQQIGLRVAGEVDERAVVVGEAAIARVEPLRRAAERFQRRVRQPRELGVRVPVPDVDELGAGAVGLVAEDPGEVRVLDISVDREVLAGAQPDPDLEDDPCVPAQLVLGHRPAAAGSKGSPSSAIRASGTTQSICTATVTVPPKLLLEPNAMWAEPSAFSSSRTLPQIRAAW